MNDLISFIDFKCMHAYINGIMYRHRRGELQSAEERVHQVPNRRAREDGGLL